MQILDVILPSRLEMIESSEPHFLFEDDPEYKEMVRRATDSLQRIQDSISAAAHDSAQAVSDTLSATMPPVSGGIDSGDGMTMLINVLGSIAAVVLCACAIYLQRRKTQLA